MTVLFQRSPAICCGQQFIPQYAVSENTPTHRKRKLYHTINGDVSMVSPLFLFSLVIYCKGVNYCVFYLFLAGPLSWNLKSQNMIIWNENMTWLHHSDWKWNQYLRLLFAVKKGVRNCFKWFSTYSQMKYNFQGKIIYCMF